MDLAVGIIVIMVFIGLIATLFYNFYLSTTAKNRNAIATNCIIDVIEQIKAMDYDEVNLQTINLKIATLEEEKTIPKGYKVTATVKKYNETEGNTEKMDFIKILTVVVEYEMGKKTEKIEISTLIEK